MRVARAIAAAGLCCVLMGGCADNRPAELQTYVVRSQDTLYSIAWRHDLDYRDLAKWNNIGSDYRLSVGQVLVLQPRARSTAAGERASTPRAAASAGASAPHAVDPGTASSPPRAAGSTAAATPPQMYGSATSSPNSPRVGKPAPDAPVADGAKSRAAAPAAAMNAATGGNAREPEPVPAPGVGTAWTWPTERSSPPDPVPGGGILLLGRLGQDVRAAASGKVVYIGSGIRGYGNLVIIKHGDTMLSSYAHNRDVLVHEGQEVMSGQIIAHMGTGPHQISALYFEIRVNGKPIDPLRYLPASQ